METFVRAVAGDRDAAAQLWRQLAQGLHDDETQAWIEHVAHHLLDADRVKGNRRPDAVLKAVGLVGRPDHNAEAARLVALFDDLADLSAREQRGDASRKLVEQLRAAGVVSPALSDLEVQRLITRLRGRPPK